MRSSNGVRSLRLIAALGFSAGMALNVHAQGGWQGEIRTPTPTPAPAAAASATPTPQPSPAGLVLPTKTAPEERLVVFFKHLQAGEVDEGYRVLLEGSRIAASAGDVAMLKTKTREAIGVIGAITGFDELEVKPAGEHLRRYTCLALGSEFPLRWRFYFYRSNDVWRLIDIRISDRLMEFFGDAPSADEAERSE